MGSLSLKIPKKRWNNDDAFPEKELYLNLTSTKQNEDDDLEYDFKFLSEDEYKNERKDNAKCWFKVKDILYSNLKTVKHKARENFKLSKLAKQNLSLLYKKIRLEKVINYYEVSGKSMDDVLVIFVRATSKGIKLSKTDLLFSTVVAHWNNARDEIDKFLSRINKKGDHYEFNTDFIMRTCLYTLDMPILMKIENFNQENVERIRNNWSDIKSAIEDTVDLLAEQGFSAENIISNNALLPIIHYRFRKGTQALSNPAIKEDFRKYFALSQIKKIFGGHSNQTLEILRNKINELEQFSLKAIENVELSYENTLSCDSKEIEEWLDTFKKGPYTFFLISLLYPEIKFGRGITYEQDHMHPFSGFKRNELEKIVLKNGKKLSSEDIENWIRKRETLPNLEPLTDKENEEKKDTDLKTWISLGHEDKYLPKKGINNYEFSDFINFYDKRKAVLKEKLEYILL